MYRNKGIPYKNGQQGHRQQCCCPRCCSANRMRPCQANPSCSPHDNKVCQEQEQGNLSQCQGDQSQDLGDSTQAQGDQSQTQGQCQKQGDQSETQGDLSASQGDQFQTQGGEAQGDQTQGDQTQAMNGHGGQMQGEQNQTMTGHGGQTQGDQTLSSSPTIATPVNVSGVNVNVTVSCDDVCKENSRDSCNDCRLECRNAISSLLSLIRTFSLAITEPSSSLIGFYSCGLETSPDVGNLGSVTDCTFVVSPESEGNEITVLIDTLEALSFEPVTATPNLFSLLLAYLQALPVSANDQNGSNDACCTRNVLSQLQPYYAAGIQLQINLAKTSFVGYIYKINSGIVYLVDDLASPTQIDAIPVCKILSFQPQ